MCIHPCVKFVCACSKILEILKGPICSLWGISSVLVISLEDGRSSITEIGALWFLMLGILHLRRVLLIIDFPACVTARDCTQE